MCDGVSGAGGGAGAAGAAQQQRVASPNVGAAGAGVDQVAQMLQQFIAQMQQSTGQVPPGTLGIG